MPSAGAGEPSRNDQSPFAGSLKMGSANADFTSWPRARQSSSVILFPSSLNFTLLVPHQMTLASNTLLETL